MSSDRALATAYSVKYATEGKLVSSSKQVLRHPPDIKRTRTSNARLEASLNERPFDVDQLLAEASVKKGTVLYLAYGSNLCNETFRDKRGIRPLSQINVQVPSLRMTFDLPGLPYSEPCFANSALRDPNNDPPKGDGAASPSEKNPSEEDRIGGADYKKDRWHKGLIGVVYEVTPKDYAHIIATEGGGSGYQDIVVDCHPFASSDPTMPVPQDPTLPPFKAHTLFAPALPPGKKPPGGGGHLQRPDTSYAQASARYLKLITDGADELQLPYEYQDYLHSLQPYTITTNKQRLGQFIFLSLWAPVVTAVFALGRLFAGDDGRLPRWLRRLTSAIFQAVWLSYDGFFKETFGDGERTIGQGAAALHDHASSPRDRRWLLGTVDEDVEKGPEQNSRWNGRLLP